MDKRNRDDRNPPVQQDIDLLEERPTQIVIETASQSGVGTKRTVKTEGNTR